MEKILTQEESDALFRATQKGQIPADGVEARQKNISNFDIWVSGRISKDQARALSTLPGRFPWIRPHSSNACKDILFESLVDV